MNLFYLAHADEPESITHTAYDNAWIIIGISIAALVILILAARFLSRLNENGRQDD
jgi:hypothetical protein